MSPPLSPLRRATRRPQIRKDGFKSLAEGEAVEFGVDFDQRGRKVARDVSGPDGAQVLGQPRLMAYADAGDDMEDDFEDHAAHEIVNDADFDRAGLDKTK